MRALILSFVVAAGCNKTDVLDRQYVEGRLLVRACTSSFFLDSADVRSGVECSVQWDGEEGPSFDAVSPVMIAWGRPLYVGHIERGAADHGDTYETVVWGRREGKHYRRITRVPLFHGERPLYTAQLDSGGDEGAEVVVWGAEELNREAFCSLTTFVPFEGGLRYNGVPYEPTGGRSACTNPAVTRTWYVESHRLVLR